MTAFEYVLARHVRFLREEQRKRELTPGELRFLERVKPAILQFANRERVRDVLARAK